MEDDYEDRGWDGGDMLDDEVTPITTLFVL